MQTSQHPNPQHPTSPNASESPVVSVTISGGHVVQMDAPDWDKLAATFSVGGFYLNSDGSGRAYVTTANCKPFGDGRRTPTSLARVLTGAGPGKQVRYLNGDRLDLRRANLKVLGGAGRNGPSQSTSTR